MEITKQIFEGIITAISVIYGIISILAPIEIFIISCKVNEIKKDIKKRWLNE